MKISCFTVSFAATCYVFVFFACQSIAFPVQELDRPRGGRHRRRAVGQLSQQQTERVRPHWRLGRRARGRTGGTLTKLLLRLDQY